MRNPPLPFQDARPRGGVGACAAAMMGAGDRGKLETTPTASWRLRGVSGDQHVLERDRKEDQEVTRRRAARGGGFERGPRRCYKRSEGSDRKGG